MKTIPLTRGKYTIVDDVDHQSLSQYKWHYNSDGYARRSIRQTGGRPNKVILMHRLIAKTPIDKETDHINGNRLDNRRKNLRVCSRGENLRNRKLNKNNNSGFKGVCWNSKNNKWQAGIKIKGRSIHLGFYENINEAAEAYNNAARQIFGEYAKLNKA